MGKLIITCCLNDPSFWQGTPGVHTPATVREIADAARAAHDAGAAIVHIHEPLTPDKLGPVTGEHAAWREWVGHNMEAWAEVSRIIRQESDVITEHGQAGRPYLHTENRRPPIPPEIRQQKYDIVPESPDLINVVLGPQHTGGPRELYIFPSRDDLVRWMETCRKGGVKPGFEVWTPGCIYNLRWLAEKGLVEPPYWVELFLGMSTSIGSPPTVEELVTRVRYLPENSLWTVCPCLKLRGGECDTRQQMALLAAGMTLGGHVRVGFEDNPYYWDGVPADSNAQLVERIVRIARDIGREVATPDEARRIIGLRRRA